MARCEHCLIEFPDREIVYENEDGSGRVFCCQGCRGIHRLIHGAGLSSFYEQRESWTPGPPPESYREQTFDTEAFARAVKRTDSHCEIDLLIGGIRCSSCVWLNEQYLLRAPGVLGAVVNFATHRARVRYDPEKITLEDLLRRISAIGYTPAPAEEGAERELRHRESRDLLLRLGTAIFLAMQLMIFSAALYAGYFQGIDPFFKSLFHLIAFVLATPVFFYSGYPFLRGAISGVRNRALNMDLLIAIGSGAAYFFSIYRMFVGGDVYFDTATMIITFVLLGRAIETGAGKRTSELVGRLLRLSPRIARKVIADDGAEPNRGEYRTVPLSDILVGDLLQIIPGEKFPLDGFVLAGTTEADESMLTGESRPVPKETGAEVFAGTINQTGAVIVRVTRASAETRLAGIVRAVEEAQIRKAPVQRLADRFIRYFVPAILLLSLGTGLFWFFREGIFVRAMMNAIAVLVIACPCALGLATPLAILVATTRAASRGILIRGGDITEKLAGVTDLIFDKTGTITTGRLTLSAFAGIGLPDKEALRLAASLERLSEHAVGRALVEAAGEFQTRSVDDFQARIGLGIEGRIDGRRIIVGSRRYLRSEGIDIAGLSDPGRKVAAGERLGATVIYAARDEGIIGVFAVSDTLRREAPEVIEKSKRAGLRIHLITGDDAGAAAAIQERIHFDEVRAGLTPREKGDFIRRLNESGLETAMVGDGINDAPALVEAGAGIAMGGATDIAMESADIVLLREDLTLIPETVALARKTLAIIRQNLVWALLYNLAALPLALSGSLHPVVAAAAMAFSSVSVVFNSLRIGWR